MLTFVGKVPQYQSSGLAVDELAIPAYDFEGTRFHTRRIKFNLSAYDHKEYPTCPSCQSKYVPVQKEDKECFKCLMTKPHYG